MRTPPIGETARALTVLLSYKKWTFPPMAAAIYPRNNYRNSIDIHGLRNAKLRFGRVRLALVLFATIYKS